MQTIDKLRKQLLLGTEINAILKQSNKLLDIVKENQEYSHKLQEESNRLEKEIEAEVECVIAVPPIKTSKSVPLIIPVVAIFF